MDNWVSTNAAARWPEPLRDPTPGSDSGKRRIARCRRNRLKTKDWLVGRTTAGLPGPIRRVPGVGAAVAGGDEPFEGGGAGGHAYSACRGDGMAADVALRPSARDDRGRTIALAAGLPEIAAATTAADRRSVAGAGLNS